MNHRKKPARMLMSIACIVAAVLPSSCRNNPSTQKNKRTPAAEEATATLDRLYDAYLEGTPEEARAHLIESAQFVDALSAGREDGKYLLHARLHCLAKAMGKEEEANLEYLATRYWLMMKYKQNSADDTASEVFRRLEENSEGLCDRFVIEFDRFHTNGRGARYWKLLPGGPVEPEHWWEERYREDAEKLEGRDWDAAGNSKKSSSKTQEEEGEERAKPAD